MAPSTQSPVASERERVVVAMSGGVDSSVAAAILSREGYEVIGVTMQLSGDASRCCSLEDADDARRVADALGIRFFVANYADQFRQEVIEAFADEYLAGRTPIPCVTCNSRFKFEHLMSRASVFGSESVATGHYARIEIDDSVDGEVDGTLHGTPHGTLHGRTGLARLFRSRDRRKDQSYFLFELTQDQLVRARFPLGEMSKDEVRKLARELGLATADKAESQEICFVPDGDYAAVVEKVRPEAAAATGEVVDRDGRVLATHKGIHRFTIGQRHGLGIADANKPLYVSRIDPETGRIIVGDREDLASTTAQVGRVNWIAGRVPIEPARACVQVRHRHEAALATIHPLADGGVRVAFDQPVESVTPGQAAVFYDAEHNEEVLGGGWIDELRS